MKLALFLLSFVYGSHWKATKKAGRVFGVQIFKHLLIIQRYCHAVTKGTTRIPGSETGGGILADEMGMGKSLSILALITKTLESAYIWISTQRTDIPDGSHARKRPSRATLVIVPSASMFLPFFSEF